jgi:CheY-like chemotaxis protein
MGPLRCILLVDDDPTNRFLHRRLLTQLSVAEHMLEAANGMQALDLIHAQCADDFRTCPDLILLDMRMPVMDGIEFLKAYRALPEEKQCAKVVVMLTTSLNPRDVERAAQLSVSTYLTKPLTAGKISALVRDYFAPSTPPSYCSFA